MFVNEFVSRYGCPKRVHSDQGGCFVGEVIKVTCEMLGIDRSKTTSFHPQANSIVERTNRSLLNMFAKLLENHQHEEWDRNLPLLLLGLRSQVHPSLGVSPYCVLFGREPRLPVQIEIGEPVRGRTRPITEYLDELRSRLKALHSVALEKSRSSHEKNKRMYDRKVHYYNFSPGDKVYLHKGVVPRGAYYKFLRPRKPAVVVDKVGELNYRIRVLGAKSTLLVHHNRLKPRVAEDTVVVSRRPDQTRSEGSQSRAVYAIRGTGEGGFDGGINGLQWNGHSTAPAEPVETPVEPVPIQSFLNPFALHFIPGQVVRDCGVDANSSQSVDTSGDQTDVGPAARSRPQDTPTPAPRRSSRLNKGVQPDRLIL